MATGSTASVSMEGSTVNTGQQLPDQLTGIAAALI